MSEKISDVLRKIRRVADYQFGRGAGEKLFPDNITVVFSRKMGKIRHIYLDGRLLATLKPSVGLFSLTIEGAKRLIETIEPKRLWVQVQGETADFVERGSDVFARHVINADEEIISGEEVIVLNENDRVLAVGRAVLSGREMKSFRRGIAVKVRRGNAEKIKKKK